MKLEHHLDAACQMGAGAVLGIVKEAPSPTPAGWCLGQFIAREVIANQMDMLK